MPIEIRELNIRVSVVQNQQEQESAPSSGNTGSAVPEKDEFIAEIVEQVLELIKQRTER